MRWSHRCRENAFSLGTCRRVSRGHGSAQGLVSPSSRIGREMATKRTGVCGADVLVDAGVSCGVVVGCGLLPGHAVLGGYDADDPHLVVVDWLVVERAAERVEGSQVARVVLWHIGVQVMRDWEHEARALGLSLFENTRVHLRSQSNPELRAFGNHAP